MKNSLKTTSRWPVFGLAAGILSISAFQAQAAIYWPGQTGDDQKNKDFTAGYEDGQTDCREAPQPCGVKIYPMTKDQGFGETEPNDHILNADGLLLGRFYHANSLGAYDEDWYYIVTDKRNQKLTLYFLGDAGNFALTKGWLIKVRDLNGNIIASFDSDNGQGDNGGDNNGGNADNQAPTTPLDSVKIAEVTLPKVGTYYISVESQKGGSGGGGNGGGDNGGGGNGGGGNLDTGELRGYNIAANLEDTKQITPDPDGTFFDTETEPNDDKLEADVLRSNVPMVGVFDRTLVKTFYPPKPGITEIQYFYTGCRENDTSTIPLGLTSCECDLTSVDNNGNIDPPNPNTVPSQEPKDACYATEVSTPATDGEWKGRFVYDVDTYVFHSEGNEQLRLQICTRTDCDFEEVHLRVNKDNTSIVVMEGPVKPGQTIDLGAALKGDYYFEFSAQKTGVEPDTGNPIETDLVGPYDLLLMSTKFSPHGQ